MLTPYSVSTWVRPIHFFCVFDLFKSLCLSSCFWYNTERIQNFPGVCDGIFFDEASADITDEDGNLTPTGELYERYNNYVVDKVFPDPDDPVRAKSWTSQSREAEPSSRSKLRGS